MLFIFLGFPVQSADARRRLLIDRKPGEKRFKQHCRQRIEGHVLPSEGNDEGDAESVDQRSFLVQGRRSLFASKLCFPLACCATKVYKH